MGVEVFQMPIIELEKSKLGFLNSHRDLIDTRGFWDIGSGSTWNEALSIIQSWLQQNPDIKIKYGEQ